MTDGKQFIIDVEEGHQENGVFEYNEKLDDYEFVCFEDDSDRLVAKLNEQSDKINKLVKYIFKKFM